LLDFILGFNSSPDPVGELLEGILIAREKVAQRGGYLSIVASICGTAQDKQNLNLQIKKLKDNGVIVFNSNAQAARFPENY